VKFDCQIMLRIHVAMINDLHVAHYFLRATARTFGIGHRTHHTKVMLCMDDGFLPCQLGVSLDQ
jgi:hypothetical protein